jgi:hypothetical protein
MRIVLALAAASLCAAACASPGPSNYSREFAALQQQCDARGGTLRPMRNQTDRPANDYTCVIRGGPSERPLEDRL